MELVSMLAAILFLTIYTIGALIYEYFYEIRYLFLQATRKLGALLGIGHGIHDDPTGRNHP